MNLRFGPHKQTRHPCRFLGLFAAAVAILMAGCNSDGESEDDSPPAGVEAWFPLTVGSKAIEAQFAVRENEVQKGLMFRKSLDEHSGMLFVYTRPHRMSYYMRNTSIPLDIGFFRPDGTLGEVHQMHPFDESSVPSYSDDYQYALEMNQGWFKANGIKSGAKLDLKAVAVGLKKRGFEPSIYIRDLPKEE